MPKVIENLEENILNETRKMLFEEGYDGVTIRKVAKKCSIAAGTVYNYYNSKEILVASTLLKDWKDILSYLQKQCEKASEVNEGIKILYDGLLKFQHEYINIFFQYDLTLKARENFMKRHITLVDCLKSMVESIFKKFSIDYDDNLLTFVSENIISATNNEYDFSSFIKVLEKTYK